MSYYRRPVVSPLDSAVDHIWVFEGYRAPVHRGSLFADGCTDLMFKLDDSLTVVRSNRGTSWRGGWVSGQRTEPIDVVLERRWFTMVGARLRPAGLPALVGAPAAEFVDGVVALGEFWSHDADRACDQMARASTPVERLDILERWLLRRFRFEYLASAPLADAVERLRASPAEHTVATLAEDLGTSHRQLRRIFRQHVGVSPKVFQSISRFRHLLRGLSSGPGKPRWAHLALDNGYSDQAHLCREFRMFAGITPTRCDPPPPVPDYLPWAPVPEHSSE